MKPGTQQRLELLQKSIERSKKISTAIAETIGDLCDAMRQDILEYVKSKHSKKRTRRG